MRVKERKEIYRCNVCGNIVEILTVGGGELFCCNKSMELITAKIHDSGGEKHIPVVEIKENIAKIKIGKILHPMEEKHYIEWIDIETDKTVYKRFLAAKEKPEIEIAIEGNLKKVSCYCNIHGLWSYIVQ